MLISIPLKIYIFIWNSIHDLINDLTSLPYISLPYCLYIKNNTINEIKCKFFIPYNKIKQIKNLHNKGMLVD
ncbi:hypothetical protein CN287_22120 [Bacillus cereus]|nr:hypothetical protein COM77_29695 [Bacillus cereus]PEE93237.1 hypothetical protein COM92_19095 [Bacillus cereus]PFC16255.1 hypothetical protein CN287_22120 [Bacillus cereus]PGN68894.1 hypothetical protein CN967_30395 [Bacillus cereus]